MHGFLLAMCSLAVVFSTTINDHPGKLVVRAPGSLGHILEAPDNLQRRQTQGFKDIIAKFKGSGSTPGRLRRSLDGSLANASHEPLERRQGGIKDFVAKFKGSGSTPGRRRRSLDGIKDMMSGFKKASGVTTTRRSLDGSLANASHEPLERRQGFEDIPAKFKGSGSTPGRRQRSLD